MIWYVAQTSKVAGEMTITVCEISAPYQFRWEWTCAWRTMEGGGNTQPAGRSSMYLVLLYVSMFAMFV